MPENAPEAAPTQKPFWQDILSEPNDGGSASRTAMLFLAFVVGACLLWIVFKTHDFPDPWKLFAAASVPGAPYAINQGSNWFSGVAQVLSNRK